MINKTTDLRWREEVIDQIVVEGFFKNSKKAE